jgi:X-Pro dipeptidyl-peptidase C-terminal non-catalytic domain
VPSQSAVGAGSASFAAVPGSASSSGGGFMNVPVPDAPGTFASYDTAALGTDTDIVGIPRLTVRLDAPTFAGTQGADPAGKLVVFAKLLDVAPDGSTTLPRNQLSATRVADVTKPVQIELPGIVYRFAKGHHMRLVLGTSNSTNRTNTVGGPVSVVTSRDAPGTLSLPDVAAAGAKVGTLAGRCLSARSPIGPRNIGRVRINYTRNRLLKVPVLPERRSSRAFRYCVKGRSGTVHAVFSSRSARKGRVLLVTTTARGHGNRNVRVGSSARRFRHAYSRRRAFGRGIFRASPRSPRLIGVRRGKVRYIAVANRRVLKTRRTLRRYLRLAGL